MARYCGPVCRLCRREGEKLFLKGERCYTDKCAVERRETPPGQHGRGRQQFSNFKVQLREKQKAKRMFRVLERSFRGYFERAYRRKGVTGTQLLQSLETRLDSIVYRLGFGFSRAHARQLVTHGHVLVNGKPVNIASFQVKIGDTVEIKEASKQDVTITSALQAATARPVPAWMNLDREKLRGTINALPTREQLPQNIKEQLIVELYSR